MVQDKDIVALEV